MRAADILAGASNGAFAIDVAERIIGWNPVAERLFGLTSDSVVGRPCYEVLGCRDHFGYALSAETCSLLQAIRDRRPPSPISSLVHHRSGDLLELSESAILLPEEDAARAVVLVQPSPSGIVDPPGGPHGLDLTGVLDRVLIVTGADSAELLLVAPQSDELVLVAQRGEAPRAFREITRFAPGQGFPGLVAQTGRPLISLDLRHDDRYLRLQVKRRGFRSYWCVPVYSGTSFLGTLQVASRRRAEAGGDHLPFLRDVARELGRALELARLRAAESLAGHLFTPELDVGVSLSKAADRALRTLTEAAAAQCGVLLLLDRTSGMLQTASEWNVPARLRRALARTCATAECPALREGRCLVRPDASHPQHARCCAVQRDLPGALCLPLVVDGTALGVVVAGYAKRDPLLTRHLGSLHTALSRAALVVHNTQIAQREAQLAGQHAAPGPGRLPGAGTTLDQQPRPEEETREGHAHDGPLLDLRCLGQFRMFRDGQPVPTERFARRRSLALLKILLTRYGKPVHREELIELLWPESGLQSGSMLLNVVVHYLRRGLEPDVPAGRPSRYIRTVGEHYAFDTASSHRLDTQEFLDAIRRGAQSEAAGRQVEAAAAYQRALTLYAGDFLEDEPFSDWCALEREYLRESYLSTLERAARLQLEQGDPVAAIAYYRRALLTDATREHIHRDLMRALFRVGRRDEAVRQYRDCRLVLERELGIAPLPETETLYREIVDADL